MGPASESGEGAGLGGGDGGLWHRLQAGVPRVAGAGVRRADVGGAGVGAGVLGLGVEEAAVGAGVLRLGVACDEAPVEGIHGRPHGVATNTEGEGGAEEEGGGALHVRGPGG